MCENFSHASLDPTRSEESTRPVATRGRGPAWPGPERGVRPGLARAAITEPGKCPCISGLKFSLCSRSNLSPYFPNANAPLTSPSISVYIRISHSRFIYIRTVMCPISRTLFVSFVSRCHVYITPCKCCMVSLGYFLEVRHKKFLFASFSSKVTNKFRHWKEMKIFLCAWNSVCRIPCSKKVLMVCFHRVAVALLRLNIKV